MNKGELTGVLMVDLCKAFDLVDHSLLLTSNNKYGKLSDRSDIMIPDGIGEDEGVELHMKFSSKDAALAESRVGRVIVGLK